MCEQVDTKRQDKQEACRTYIEQTKLLVTLASAFIVAPAGILALDRTKLGHIEACVCHIVAAEVFFVASVLTGYIVLGTVAGSQHKGTYYVYRAATMIFSIAQIATYVIGLGLFIYVLAALLAT